MTRLAEALQFSTNLTAQVWVLGGLNRLNPSKHQTWANDSEISQINSLRPDELWIRDNKTRATLVAKSGELNPQVELAQLLRFRASRKRDVFAVPQIAKALDAITGPRPSKLDLYPRLCDLEALISAWHEVRKGRPDSHGIDKVTLEMFEQNLDRELQRLREELRSRTYRCHPLRRVYIPKADGERRPIGIACIRDIDHDVLFNLISRKIGDVRILDLIHHLLTVDVFEITEILPNEIGVPQGSPLSPLLCNIYLHPLDKHLQRLGIQFVRYADDIR